MALAVRWQMGAEWSRYNSLDQEDHKSLARWAADCAGHVLRYFEQESPDDDRPRNAIETARAWTRDELTMNEAREAALAAHTAAREADQTAACEAARAAGHAAGTAHVDGHATEAANYAIKAAIAAAPNDTDAADTEREWQCTQLPTHLRSVITTDQRTD
jgi:hypothetical protein